MSWEFSVRLDDDARGALSGMAAAARDLRPAMDLIGEMLMTATDQRFVTETDPDGGAWTPLAPATVKRKAKAGHEGMLQWSGRLRGSITRQVESDSVTVGTNVAYAAAQQFGADITRRAQSRRVLRRFVETAGRKELQPGFAKRSKANFASRHQVPEHSIVIPPRPFLGISASDRQRASVILRSYLLRGGQ